MSNQVSWEFWAKVCVRSAGKIDREKTIADLDAFITLRSADQEKAKEVIDVLLRNNAAHDLIRVSDLIPVAVNRLAGDSLDGNLRDALTERCREVCDAIGVTKKGLKNPYYIQPAPTSRELAASGHVR